MNYFSDDELKCSHCGELVFDEEFRRLLNSVRANCGFALPVSSGYRCHHHPIEAAKSKPGTHALGKAVDIAVSGDKAFTLIKVAMDLGIQRIGVQQVGTARFIHLDVCSELPSPTVWSY